MSSVFWDKHGIIHVDFLPRGATINSEYYCHVLSDVHKRLRKKRPGLITKGVLFLQQPMGKEYVMVWGGNMKRLAAKASLRPYEDQILISFQVFTWCKSNIKSTEFFFFTGEKHTKEGKLLEKLYQAVKPIPGAQKFHRFLPASKTVLLTKVFSQSKESHAFPLMGEALKQTLTVPDVK